MVEGREDPSHGYDMRMTPHQEGEASPKAPPESVAATETSSLATAKMEYAIEADIQRLLDGFDERLEVVNRRLDHVLERSAAE